MIYAYILDCDCVIEEKNYANAFKALVELNNRNDLKSGGRYPKPVDVPANEPHKAVWFEGMPWNYPEKLCSVGEILEVLRFEVFDDINNGELVIEAFRGYLMDEAHFFRALAPFIKPGSFIKWGGDDNFHRLWEFDGKEMHEFEGEVVWRPI